MFNIKQFNLNPFNEWIAGITWIIAGDITYGGYILHKTSNISLRYADIHNGGRIEDNTYDKPDIDWLGLNSYFMRAKTVTLEWILKWSTKEDLENRMKVMLGNLAKPNQRLQVLTAWTYQRAIAYCANLWQVFARREHFHNTFVPFTIVFQINSPFWESVQINATTYNITTALQEEIINTGTAKANPIITLSFISATSVDEISIDFWDQTLTIEQAIEANDIVRIDSESKTVLLNWDEIDYTWQLPLLEVWSNPFTISPNWTYDCDVSINYRNKFI